MLNRYDVSMPGKIMERFPLVEVLGRHVALKLGMIRKCFNKNEKLQKDNIAQTKTLDICELEQDLRSLNIEKGDLLLVHSSYRPLKAFGMSPDDMIDFLLELVGESGTLVMPAFVGYGEKVSGNFQEESNSVYTYNVQESHSWTGIITDKFWRRSGVIRSVFPDNSLAACGPLAQAMFSKEMNGDLAHGKSSAWEFCRINHAKVLFLGIPAFKSVTEIHLCEDRLDDQFPIKEWFKQRTYTICDAGQKYERKTRIRKQFWSRFLTEYRCSYKLRKHGLLDEFLFHGINISFISDLFSFSEFVEEKAKNGDLLIFRVPKKYYKKEGI